MPKIVVIAAGFSRDGEPRRHRKRNQRHIRQIGALAAEQVLQMRAALGLSVAEEVNALHRFRFGWLGFPFRGSGQKLRHVGISTEITPIFRGKMEFTLNEAGQYRSDPKRCQFARKTQFATLSGPACGPCPGCWNTPSPLPRRRHRLRTSNVKPRVFHLLKMRLHRHPPRPVKVQPDVPIAPPPPRTKRPIPAAGIFQMQIHPNRRILEQQRRRLDHDALPRPEDSSQTHSRCRAAATTPEPIRPRNGP